MQAPTRITTDAVHRLPDASAFSTWQKLNFAKSDDKDAMLRTYTAACVQMRFVAGLRHEQIEVQRNFLNEHPKYASLWQLPCMKNMESMSLVVIAHGDQF